MSICEALISNLGASRSSSDVIIPQGEIGEGILAAGPVGAEYRRLVILRAGTLRQHCRSVAAPTLCAYIFLLAPRWDEVTAKALRNLSRTFRRRG